jgi:hypothetical protein
MKTRFRHGTAESELDGPHMVKKNAAETQEVEVSRIQWKREDCIRWIKLRIRELSKERENYAYEHGKKQLRERTAASREFVPRGVVVDHTDQTEVSDFGE